MFLFLLKIYVFCNLCFEGKALRLGSFKPKEIKAEFEISQQRKTWHLYIVHLVNCVFFLFLKNFYVEKVSDIYDVVYSKVKSSI